MDIDIDLLRRVAKIARLNLSDEELEKMLPDFKEIIDIFSRINKVDTEDIDLSFLSVDINNVFREDNIKKSLSSEEALKNAVHKQDDYFKGPKIL